MLATIFRLHARAVARRRMRAAQLTEETIRHGLEAGDRVRTPQHGLATVYWADIHISRVIVEPDVPPLPGVWCLDFAVHHLERV